MAVKYDLKMLPTVIKLERINFEKMSPYEKMVVILYWVSPNAVCMLGWKIENIVRSHNYVRKHRRKAINDQNGYAQ